MIILKEDLMYTFIFLTYNVKSMLMVLYANDLQLFSICSFITLYVSGLKQ